MYKENLSTKNIKEFVEGDTIYIKNNKEFNKPFYLCEFIKYEKGKVYGKQIAATQNERSFNIENADVISAYINYCGLYGKSKQDEHSFFHYFDRSGYALHPDEDKKVSESGETYVAKHPSYGMIGLYKSQSSGSRAFFGSSIKATNMITLRISKGELDRKLNNDWYHATDEIIEVCMTQNQFSELITSFNQGDGIPCTISHINHDIMPECPYNSKIEQFQEEFKNKVKNTTVDLEILLKETREVLGSAKSPNKGQRTDILNKIEKVLMEINSNIPFIKTQFDEQMSKSVAEAKSEIEAFLNSSIEKRGLDGLNSDINAIEIE